MRNWKSILKAAVVGWWNNAFVHSAALSFCTLFSLAPVTVIAVGVAGFFVGDNEANRQMRIQLRQLVGRNITDMIFQAMSTSQAHSPRANIWSTVSGVILLLVGASSTFNQLQSSLNAIWGAHKLRKRSGWARFLLQRFLSFAMVVVIGFVLLVSLILTTALTVFTEQLGIHHSRHFVHTADFAVSLMTITLLFALIFKILPDISLRWRDVWMSAFLTSILFTVGRFVIALYLAHSAIATIYGAAGSLAALLVWVYYSCAILLFGVEFNRAHYDYHHTGPPPAAPMT